MNIEWINNQTKNSAVTIYNNNITLSKKAAKFFDDALGVQIGLDKNSQSIVIKKFTKDESHYNNIDEDELLKVEMKSSYGRINSRKVILALSEKLNLDFQKNQSFKYNAKWNTVNKMLIIDTKGDQKNDI